MTGELLRPHYQHIMFQTDRRCTVMKHVFKQNKKKNEGKKTSRASHDTIQITPVKI